MKIGLLALMITGLIVTGATASAQPAPRSMPGDRQAGQDENVNSDDPAGRAGVPSEQKWEEVRKKMETVRMWRLTEKLKLDEKTSTKLAALLSSIDQRRGALMREKAAIIRDLPVLLNAQKRDEKKIKSAVKSARKIQDEMMDLRKKEATGIRNLLTIEQQAQYLVFQHEFQREMRGMIAGARGQGRGGKGMRSGMGPGQGPRGAARPAQ